MDDDFRARMNTYRGVRLGGEPADELGHFCVCTVCGQAVDKRKLGDVFHHLEEGHAPIPTASH